MKVHDPAMQFANDEAAKNWQTAHDANKDEPYGYAVIRFASEWCTRMEQAAAEIGAPMETHEEQAAFFGEHARRIEREADNEGITGFMYGCAMSIIANVWKYGEGLRRWHNLKTQIGTEGEKANESGGVLNPALLSLG